MVTEGPGGHRGPSAPSQAACRRMRAGLGPGKAVGPQSCRETKRSVPSPARKMRSQRSTLDNFLQEGADPPRGTHGCGHLGTVSI